MFLHVAISIKLETHINKKLAQEVCQPKISIVIAKEGARTHQLCKISTCLWSMLPVKFTNKFTLKIG